MFFACCYTDEILHDFETRGNHDELVFAGESSFQGFLGGAKFCPSTVGFTAAAGSAGKLLFFGGVKPNVRSNAGSHFT